MHYQYHDSIRATILLKHEAGKNVSITMVWTDTDIDDIISSISFNH